MNIETIQDLVDQFDRSSLTEFELKKADFSLYLNKNNQPGHSGNYNYRSPVADNVPSEDQAVMSANNIKESVIVGPEFSAEKSAKSVLPKELPIKEDPGKLITSPIVGVVYLQPTPEDSAFVKVGDQVKAQQTVCIIEAMKMMNEIPAGLNGEITEIIVQNEQVVGIGDPLFRVKEL
jgi:acetyl-CoA carboxylase biotin carboxyl carrier protein